MLTDRSVKILLMIKKKTNTEKEILAAAGKLFSEQGYFGTSMSEIAHKAGVSKATLYYYFESKEILCKKLMKGSCSALKKELKKAISESTLPADIFFNVVRTLLDFRIKHPEIGLLTNFTFSNDEKKPLAQFIAKTRKSVFNLVRQSLVNLDFMRKKGHRFIYIFSASTLGFAFGPLAPKHISSRELSRQLTQPLLNQKKQKLYA